MILQIIEGILLFFVTLVVGIFLVAICLPLAYALMFRLERWLE